MGNKGLSSILQTAIIAAGLLIASCGDGGPTKPNEVRLPKFYFRDIGNPNQIHVYDVRTDSLRTLLVPDGVFGPSAGYGPMAGSSCLRRLYLGDYRGGLANTGVYDLDLDSLIDIKPIPSYYGIAVSPDDRLLALCGDSLLVVKTSDFSVVFHDSARAARPVFSRNSRTLYAVEGRNLQYAFIIRFGDSIACERHTFPTPIWRILPSPDEKRWFVYSVLGANTQGVGVYDPATDSLLEGTTTSPGRGDMEWTPDGKRLIYDSPGGYVVQGPVPFAFFFADLSTGFQVSTVNTSPLTDQDDSTFDGFRPSEMALSRDGQYLAAAPASLMGAFVIYNTWTGKFMRCWNYGRKDPAAAFASVVCVY